MQTVVIFIYDMNGKQLRSIPIASEKESEELIHAGELIPGMYMYTLIVDGAFTD
jgi:hypothetical protein